MTPPTEDEKLGERIRALREGAGLSQQAMAAELERRGIPDTSFGSYRRYETGAKSPSAAILRGVAEIAGVRPWELLADTEPGAPGPGFPGEPPPHGIQILGHLDAELTRLEEEGGARAPQEAFEIVERRVEKLRADGSLDDAGYAYWRAVRRGAVLAGGYTPERGDRRRPRAGD